MIKVSIKYNTIHNLKIKQNMLQFKPNVKKKKGGHFKWPVKPFPILTESSQRYSGVFTSISVEVCNPQDIKALYESGCFGKGSKSRSFPQSVRPTKSHTETSNNDNASESLSLDLEESFFLAYILEVLNIYNLDGGEISWQKLLHHYVQLKTNFVECFAAYLYLKSKNWVVKSGIKFGGDFVIYKKGPRFYHASFIVFISTTSLPAQMMPHDIKGLQRIAETSDKDVLLLEVTKPCPDFSVNSLEDFSTFSISETIIRRFNYTAHVQNQNSTK